MYSVGKAFRKSSFVDTVRILIKSGAGANGLPHYGGIGGKGSDMYIRAKENTTFKQFLQSNPSKRFSGKVGNHSKQHCIIGPPAEDFFIDVPVGVTVSSEGKVLADLCQHGDTLLALRGGQGGNNDNSYLGQRGQSVNVRLDLKLIADVGYVGYPNAGKSTLLRALSRAKPKVANYPFTTIRPEIGIAKYDDFRQIKMADLPGLIEGAHLNYGMGHSFLKHVERTKYLLFVVDIHGFSIGPTFPLRDAFDTVIFLNKELELYKEELLDKPTMLVLNKMDMPNSEEKLEEFLKKWKNYDESIEIVEDKWKPLKKVYFDDIISVAAMKRVGTDKVKSRLRELIDFHADVNLESQMEEKKSREKTNNIQSVQLY